MHDIEDRIGVCVCVCELGSAYTKGVIADYSMTNSRATKTNYEISQ